MEKPRHRGRSVLVALLVIVVAFVVLVAGFFGTLWLLGDRLLGHGADNPVIPPDHCLAVADQYRGSMIPEQSVNAAIIVGEAIRRGLPSHAASIALATVWQESGVLNLDYGDRDSLGLFQQRPSQGWGTPDQIMNPWYSAGKFYDALVKVKDWQTRDVGEVAQAVQRSAYPDAYDQYEPSGRAWASVLTGETRAAIGCVVNDGTGGGGNELAALLTKIWGNKLTITRTDPVITISTPRLATAWSVAQVSMAELAQYGMTSVQVGDQIWQPSEMDIGKWTTTDPADAVGQFEVVITLK